MSGLKERPPRRCPCPFFQVGKLSLQNNSVFLKTLEQAHNAGPMGRQSPPSLAFIHHHQHSRLCHGWTVTDAISLKENVPGSREALPAPCSNLGTPCGVHILQLTAFLLSLCVLTEKTPLGEFLLSQHPSILVPRDRTAPPLSHLSHGQSSSVIETHR